MVRERIRLYGKTYKVAQWRKKINSIPRSSDRRKALLASKVADLPSKKRRKSSRSSFGGGMNFGKPYRWF